jgi:hypothetical protein
MLFASVKCFGFLMFILLFASPVNLGVRNSSYYGEKKIEGE